MESEEKQTEAQPVESKPKSRHSHKGAGGIYAKLGDKSEEPR